ncbi:hypothetical protein ACFOZ1_07650 [Gracilibacillus marinus]|uniref:DUF4044 domain-containing protein n=1 Tax=Gracilibacillus marinus TaxID=630535 RepID=A0ABV8VUT1_9BACI
MKQQINDQASILRDLVKKKNSQSEDMLQLPPRSSVHKKVQRKQRKKIQLVSILLFSFIMLIITLIVVAFQMQ